MPIIDLSHPISPDTPTFPGDPPVEVQVLDSTAWPDLEDHRRLNCSQLRIGVHSGTHMDAPYHFFGGGLSIEQVALEATIGPCCKVAVRSPTQKCQIDVTDLAPSAERIRSTRRVLLDSGWASQWGGHAYFEQHPVITVEAARWLVDQQVFLVGVDFPSVDHPPFPAHLELLGAGVLIIENLTNLHSLPETFQLLAQPLSITGRDGSPVRAVAVVDE